MPFLDIATTQPCVRNNVCSVSSRTIFGTRLVHTKEIRFVSSWNTFRIPSKAPNSRIKLFRSGLRIMAVATLKKGPTKNTKSNEEQNDCGGVRMAKYSNSDVEQQSSSEEAEELDEREKLRRMRISKANKGNKPWNLGRKHSPETLQRIREHTRLAMKDPKVKLKLKLANLRHGRSEETRMKISAGVRMGWEKRREMLRLQETCYYEWQNLIAEASRRGSQGEEELQWDSYEILNEQLEQEWLRSVEKQSSSEEAGDLDEREKLRRMKISKANKGNKLWNLGRKHSPETLQRIRERTRLGMQDPKVKMKLAKLGHPQSEETRMKISAGIRMGWEKRREMLRLQETCYYEWQNLIAEKHEVKMKLANLGHAQSEETRMKIGAGVRMGWEKCRGMLRLQETCYYEWQNLIAEASRRGSQGEEELQWDSYEILSEQWLRSVEERKHMPRPKGGKRAPKSA